MRTLLLLAALVVVVAYAAQIGFQREPESLPNCEDIMVQCLYNSNCSQLLVPYVCDCDPAKNLQGCSSACAADVAALSTDAIGKALALPHFCDCTPDESFCKKIALVVESCPH